MGTVSTVAPVDLEHARAVAVSAAEAAGVLLSAAGINDLDIRTKDSGGDVVTSLDLAAERLIVGHIRDAYPQHRIIAEEAGLLEATEKSWTWLVDPLDGTNNLVIGLSMFVVGIALCAHNKPVLGVVHDPVAGQTWSAIRHRGALGPDGARLRPPYRPPEYGPVLAWTQGHRVRTADATAAALRVTLESSARRVLQLWTPLLSWVLLARGDISGFVGYRPEAVDLPAGQLIAQEAGVIVRGLDGSPFDERIDRPDQDRGFVAGRPEVITDLLALVRAAREVTISGVSG